MDALWKAGRTRLSKYLFTVFAASVLTLLLLVLWGGGEFDEELSVEAHADRVLFAGGRSPSPPHAQYADIGDVAGLQEELEGRRQHVQDVCRRNGVRRSRENMSPENFHFLWVDDRHKFVYCEVPKVACTNWKRILLLLTDKMNTTDPMALKPGDVHGPLAKTYLRRLDTYSPKEVRSILREYLKVMFVRNPLERLLSAYRNKFTTKYNEYFRQRYGKGIIRHYRDNATAEALERGHDVTFEEFIRYIIDLRKTTEDFNAHWKEFYKLCHPCVAQFDVIGKYETLDRDVEYVLRILGEERNIKFPPRQNHKSTEALLKQSFANVTSEQVHQLWEQYAVDFTMFGYTYPDL